MFPDWIGDVLTGLVSSFVFLLVGRLISYLYKAFWSDYSGKWNAEIHTVENDQQILKKDEWLIKHNKRKNTVSGTIRRIIPEEQNYRKWHFQGIIQSNNLLLVYWSSEGVISRGCVNCRLISDFVFDGFYLEMHNEAIEKTPIKLVKKKQT